MISFGFRLSGTYTTQKVQNIMQKVNSASNLNILSLFCLNTDNITVSFVKFQVTITYIVNFIVIFVSYETPYNIYIDFFHGYFFCSPDCYSSKIR